MNQLIAALARWRALPLMMRAIALAALCTTFLFGMIAFEQIRRDTGAEIVLRTRPVDPRDLIRGAYVQLEYEVERIDTGALVTPPDTRNWRRDDVLFLTLRADESGELKPVALEAAKPAATQGDVVLRVKYERLDDFTQGAPAAAVVNLGADRYFSDQAGATQLEKDAREGPLSVILSVGGDGKAVIKGLVVGGQKQYETLF